MKKIFLGLTFLASSALQAGESKIDKIVSPNLTGFYMGGNLGGIWSHFHGSVADDPFFDRDGIFFPSFAQPYNTNNNSLIGGAQIGYLNRLNHFIYGTEINVLGMNLKDTHTLQEGDVVEFIDVFKPGDSFSSEINWQASWVGHLGYQLQNWLFYGLGGISITKPKISTNIVTFLDDEGNLFPASQGCDTKTLLGGTIGLGLERMLWSNFTIGLEYSYTNFGKHYYSVGQNPVSASPAGFIYTDLKADKKLINDTVLVRLNYYFNS